MKRKALFLLAASIVMQALPTKVWADGMNEAQKVTNVKTLPYPLATDPIPASAMEYDSVAKCFVVRDTIMKSTSRWRSSVVQTVETRAAVAYTEAGVQYGYYGNQLSSNNMDEMRALLDPWNEYFKNLDIEGILTPASNGNETWYMQIVGVDNNTIDGKNGEMRIYNDIGSSYNYKTIAIDGTALRDNEHIKRIVFEDCASSSANANTKLKMVIHDGAFQNCSNLQELYMYYLVTDGTNHEEMLKPTDVYIGSNVFDGCHEDFRIVVDPLVYKMFLADPNWSPYADKIVASTALPETEEEGGVLYGYYGYQLSSSQIDEMEMLLEPWYAEFRNLNLEEVLSPAPGEETWYMHIAGVDNDEIEAKGGEMRIYNDIGTTYNYKTIAIDSTALRGNEHIKKVVFEDCASASENANTELKMVIHDGAFKDCKNLKEFNMYYLATDGDNRYEMLLPTNVYIGSNVFDGCHKDFRIVVAPQVYDKFIYDANWSQYADYIVASDYLPTIHDPITVDGVTYDYASSALNTLPTSELIRLQSSWWNAAIIGVEVAVTIATFGSVGAVKASTAAANASAKAVYDQAMKISASYIGKKGFDLTSKAALVASDYWVKTVAASNLAVKKAITYAAIGMGGASVGSAAGFAGLNYIASTTGNKIRREPTWTIHGQWLMTENKHTIYHMYVKDVANQETVKLYNDIGSAYNYKTVAIGKTAFHNKTNIKTIKFEDLYSSTAEMYAPLNIVLPDSAFMGCTGLETLDLIMRSTDTNPDRDVPLGPENFIVCGEDLFVGCDTTKLKIRIGADKYEEFAENPVWGKYKKYFEVVDESEVVDFTEYGAQYSYSFEDNTLKKQSYTGGHTIEHLHIIGQNGDMESQQGEVGLFNDIGSNNNYKLDYVKKKAFYGSQELTGISMFDLKGAAGLGDAYTDLEVVLQDSAFASCPNLGYINMLYFRTDGTNTVEPMSPSRVILGRDVFAGSDNFKVKMVNTAVDEFKADTAWAKYEDRFLPSFIQTEDPELMEALKACGMEYYSPIWNETFPIYDVMKVTAPTVLDGQFQSKKFTAFRDFKAFECINLSYVGNSWFKDCTELQSIEFPSTIQTIEAQAFYNCQLLDDVMIPAEVTTIDNEAFRKCASLRSLTFLSETPATLGSDVFAEMPEDYILYVPEAAVETYKAAWPQYAHHIQTLGNRPTGIFEVVLTEPGTLAQALKLTITGTNPLTIRGNYNQYDSLKIVGPINGTDVGVIRFMGGRDVNNAEVVYGGNLKYLDLYDAHIKAGGEEYNQDGDNDLITEDNSIDTYMFWELDKLETLILPKSATKIKDNAFSDCDALNRLVIGDNMQSIGEEVTHDSPKLKEIVLLCDEVPTTDSDAWSEDRTTLRMFYTTNAIRAHLSGSHVYYTRSDSIASSFGNDILLHALAEKRIYTLEDLGALKSFENIIKGNTEITKFDELLYALEVKMLGDNSLSGCSALEEVILPYNLDTITAGAFSGCTSLKSIRVVCDSVPGLAANAFEDLPEDFVIYVLSGKEGAYRSAWPQYADHIQKLRQERDELKVVTVTEPGTLGEALGFSVHMDSPSNVGRISGDLISIKALKVIGPINGKDIAVLRMLGGREEEDGDEVALARMSYLDLYEATICTDPNHICFNRDGGNDYVEHDNEIPECMFWKLDKLQTVILPKNVTKIGYEAFYDNIGIETIIVGDATTFIDNDAFGKCKNLKNIVFLCDEKPTLHEDAFTDPISDQPYKVEKMYVPLSIYDSYVTDVEYTSHAKDICNKYTDDALFRAYGSHAVMSKDQLQDVINIDGWFNIHNDVMDLTSLKETTIDTLKAATMAPLEGLLKITLPATLKVVEENVFAANTQLQWADFAQCTKEGVLTESNIDKLGTNAHALIYAPESFTPTGYTNVVYGTEGNLKCDHLTITDDAAYAVPRAFTASAISYDRQFVKDETTTLCLPFDMAVPAGAKAYLLDGEMANAIVVAQVDHMEAGKPYVIITGKNMTFSTQAETAVPVAPNRMPQMATNNYVMAGTLKALSAEEIERQRIYLLGENDCWYLQNPQALLPYRAYLQGTTSDLPHVVQMITQEEDEMVIVDGNYTQFENLEEIVAGIVTYKRTLNNTWNALYVPFQIEMTEGLLANYDVAYINDVRSYDRNDDGELDDWDVEIIKVKKVGRILKANHPYVIRPKNDEAVNLNISQHNATLYSTAPEYQQSVTCSSAYVQYAVKGVYAKTVSADLDNGNYVYAINTKGEWQKMGLETSLVPFRIYLTMANRDGSSFAPSEFTAQSIKMRLVGEEAEDGTTDIYDLEVSEEAENDTIVFYDLQGRRVLDPKRGSLYIVNGKKVIF